MTIDRHVTDILASEPYPIHFPNKDLAPFLASYEVAALSPSIRTLASELSSDKHTLAELILAVRQWINDWVYDDDRQPIKRPQNILESRLTNADAVYETRLSSCGAISTLGAAILRVAGVPVKLIDGTHTKSADHAWLEIYFPEANRWLPFDMTGFGDLSTALINDTDYQKQGEYRDWSEMKVLLDQKHQRWLNRHISHIPALINQMFLKDRAARGALQKSKDHDGVKKQMRALDVQHASQIKTLVSQYGWTALALSSRNELWHLIQHADHDVAFQQQALVAFRQHPATIPSRQCAFLEDRIYMNLGQPQIYGSQLQYSKITSQWEVYKLSNPESVDERRSSVGLEPLANYLRQMNSN